MTRRRESWFHLLRYSLVLAAGLILFGLITVFIHDSSAVAERREAEFLRMERLSATLVADKGDALKVRTNAIALLSETQVIHGIRFVGPDGRRDDGAHMPFEGREFSDAINNGRGWRSEDDGHVNLVLAISDEHGLVGFLVSRLPEFASTPQQDSARRNIIVGGVLTLFLGALFISNMSNRHAARIEELRRYASGLASGVHEGERPDMPTWELADCAESLSQIAGELALRIQKSVQSRKELETILSSMGEGLLAVDVDGRIILMNEPCRHILGFDAHDRAPENIDELAGAEVLRDMVARSMEQGVSVSDELKFPEEGLFISAQVAPLRDEEREIGGVVCLLSDVSTIRRLESMRREFVANVSHELKTPLTAIQGVAETVAGDPDMPDATRERFLGRIVTNAHRLDSLINDVLELSRLQSSDTHLNMAPLDLRALVLGTVSDLDELAERRKIAITVIAQGEAVTVMGDRRALKSVVENLVANAIKYTPSEGRVEVRLKDRQDTVILEVEDTGEGIAPEHQDRIFERFYRVDAARSRDVGGTGLGLAIVKNCVLAHDGQIVLESEVGSGSTFRVTLPTHRD